MKKCLTAALLAALALTGCAQKPAPAEESTPENNSSQAENKSADNTPEITVHAEDGVEDEYADLISGYFAAIGRQDFEAYKAALYPPFAEAYGAYLEKDGSSLETVFNGMHDMFNEDGYESWHFSDITIANYPEERVDLDGFFNAYVSAGYFEQELADQCREEAEEIRDFQFSVSALYTGDEEPVEVISGKEIIALRTAEGVYLFG